MRVHLYTSLCCLVVLSTLADTDVFLYSFLARTDFGVEPIKTMKKLYGLLLNLRQANLEQALHKEQMN